MPNKFLLLGLGLVSVVLSRVVFLFINDPEGPNLLAVMVFAAFIFVLSLATYALVRYLLKYRRGY